MHVDLESPKKNIFKLISKIIQKRVSLSYIDMNQPWIYMYSPSQSHFPPPSPPDPLGLPSAPLYDKNHYNIVK